MIEIAKLIAVLGLGVLAFAVARLVWAIHRAPSIERAYARAACGHSLRNAVLGLSENQNDFEYSDFRRRHGIAMETRKDGNVLVMQSTISEEGLDRVLD